METIPWYRSAIIRQQVVQIIVAGLAMLGVVTDVDWSQTVEAIFAGVAAVVAVWTIITRIVKPAPNLSVAAAVKEQELIRERVIPVQNASPNRQQGRVAVQMLVALGLTAFVVALVGCSGTRAAYKAARSLPDTAFVVTEHYAALVKQAADIAQNPATPEDVKDVLKRADDAVRPIILGDDQTNRPGLRDLADAYQQVKTAQTELELQNAINDAVRLLANFINAVKSARSQTHAFTTEPRPDRYPRRCFSPRITGAEPLGRSPVCAG